jgi:hypothetical protein
MESDSTDPLSNNLLVFTAGLEKTSGLTIFDFKTDKDYLIYGRKRSQAIKELLRPKNISTNLTHTK